MTEIELLRIYIKQMIVEKHENILGEPDTTSEKHRDDPQPQYEDEEEQDADEASMVSGISGYISTPDEKKK